MMAIGRTLSSGLKVEATTWTNVVLKRRDNVLSHNSKDISVEEEAILHSYPCELQFVSTRKN